MSTPADQPLKNLRIQAHRLADKIWGAWNEGKCDKVAMYDWFERNSTSKHIGHMEAEEIKEVIKKLEAISNLLKRLYENSKPVEINTGPVPVQENYFARK